MLRVYLFLNLLFVYSCCFSQEEYNLRINLNHLDSVDFKVCSYGFSEETTIYSDTIMSVDCSLNNLFYLQSGQKKYYLFINSSSYLDFSFQLDGDFVIDGDFANFSYFLTDFYNFHQIKMDELLLNNYSSNEFEINLFNIINDDFFKFYQNHKLINFLNDSSLNYFNNLIKYEYLSTLSNYFMLQKNNLKPVVPFYRDINISLLDWDIFKNSINDINFHETDVFQNYIFNTLIIFASFNYKYLDPNKSDLFNNYLFSFAKDNLPREMLFFFFKRYISTFSVTNKQYLKNILNDIELTKEEKKYLLDSKIFDNINDDSIDKNKINISEFYLEDINGNEFSLNQLKGKLLYIDIWASWCGPCRKQFPYAAELKKKFSKRQLKKIKFIYISIDIDYEKWKKSIQKFNLEGFQFISPADKPNNASSYFNVSSIPRYIIMDQRGNIIQQNAKRPSDETLFNDLINLIK